MLKRFSNQQNKFKTDIEKNKEPPCWGSFSIYSNMVNNDVMYGRSNWVFYPKETLPKHNVYLYEVLNFLNNCKSLQRYNFWL